MTLVVIYGAPGVGKLTTALALAEPTGFKLFHNHLSFNLVEDLRWALGRWNLTAPISGHTALEVDNSTLAAEVVARRIADHFALPAPARATTGGPGS